MNMPKSEMEIKVAFLKWMQQYDVVHPNLYSMSQDSGRIDLFTTYNNECFVISGKALNNLPDFITFGVFNTNIAIVNVESILVDYSKLPGIIRGTLYIRDDSLSNFEGFPIISVKQIVVVDCKNLTSLIGLDSIKITNWNEYSCLLMLPKVTSFVGCGKIKSCCVMGLGEISSLKGISNDIIELFFCQYPVLSDAERSMLQVTEIFTPQRLHQKIFKNVHLHVKSLFSLESQLVIPHPICGPMLGLLLVPGFGGIGVLPSMVKHEHYDDCKLACEIISKYAAANITHDSIVDCQEELLELGLDEYANI